MKPVIDVKHDLSYKMCGTCGLFVTFHENQVYRRDRLNRAVGFFLYVTFLIWLIITIKDQTLKLPVTSSDLWD